MKRLYIIFSVLLMTLCQGISYAQYDSEILITSPRVYSVTEFRSWSNDSSGVNHSLSQLSNLILFDLPLNRNLSFNVVNLPVISSADGKHLSGLTDTKIRALAKLMDNTVLLSGGVNIPTGKSDLNQEETIVSSLLSDKAMGFKSSRLGKGLSINVGCGIARDFGPANVGAGIGYLIEGEYSYLEGKDSKYKPGDQINISSGFDVLFSPLFLRTDLTYIIDQKSTIDNTDIFKEGNRLLVDETVLISLKQLDAQISGVYVNRGKSKVLNVISGIEEKIYGNQLNVNGILNLKLTKFLNLKVMGENTIIAKNDQGQNGSAVFGFGSGVTIKFMQRSTLDVTGKYYVGDSDNGNTSLKGFSTIASLNLVF